MSRGGRTRARPSILSRFPRDAVTRNTPQSAHPLHCGYMKGQKLFVRPRNRDDLESIALLHSEAAVPIPPDSSDREGLVGRLAGNTVAYLVWQRVGSTLAISHLLVSSEFRGLHIGRALLSEAVKIAAASGAETIRVAQDCKLARYFEASGFVASEGSLQKTIQ